MISKLTRGPALGATGVLVALMMIVGFPMSASAATTTYFHGTTVQNETKDSPTTTMNGGSNTAGGTNWLEQWVTTRGVGSVSGQGYASMTFTSRVTSQYCQWRLGYYVSYNAISKCDYWH